MSTITEQSLMRLGLSKLMEILEFETKEGLLDYMISNDVPTLEDLAEFLNESLGICERCGNNFIVIDYAYHCMLCVDCVNSAT